MSIAEQVKQVILSRCPVTFSLYAGYGMQNGAYVRWPTGAQIAEKRNDNGRCVMARYIYADGSVLEFKWREASGYSLTAK